MVQRSSSAKSITFSSVISFDVERSCQGVDSWCSDRGHALGCQGQQMVVKETTGSSGLIGFSVQLTSRLGSRILTFLVTEVTNEDYLGVSG